MGVATVAAALLVAAMSPHEKAASLVVSGLPAPPGVSGVLVQEWSRALPRPRSSAGLAGFVRAIRAGVPCVMVSHAFCGTRFRASLEPWAYRLLREKGFDGVMITDSLSIVRRPPAYWPVRAVRAGADLLLFTSARHPREAIRALIPLARRGELDEHVARVLRFRRALLSG